MKHDRMVRAEDHIFMQVTKNHHRKIERQLNVRSLTPPSQVINPTNESEWRESTFGMDNNIETSFDSALATSTMNKCQGDEKQSYSFPVLENTLQDDHSPTHSPETQNIDSVINNRPPDDRLEEPPDINLEVKRLSLSPRSEIDFTKQTRQNSSEKETTNLSKSSSHDCTWDSLHCNETIGLLNTGKQQNNIETDNKNDNKDTRKNDNICTTDSNSAVTPNSIHRKLPEPPDSSTRKKDSLIRRFSEPGVIKKKFKQKFQLSKAKSFDFSSGRLNRQLSTAKESIDQPLFPDRIDERYYEQAKTRGRRGAVISLEINQSVSFVRKPGGEDKYYQFSFVPSSTHTNILEEE